MKSATIHETSPALVLFVKRQNELERCFAKVRDCNPRFFDLMYLTRADKAALQERLRHELSPENLTCDGELCGTDLTRKRVFLLSAQSELDAFACH